MLPKIMPLTKKVQLPISKKEARVTAFKIAEEKLLLLHKDSTEEEVEDILLNLIKEKTSGVDINELTMVDITVLLINIIDLSRGMNRNFTYKCNKKDEEGKSCGTLINLTVNALDYTISGESQNNRLVTVGDNMKCELEYPSYNLIKQLKKYDESEMLVRLYSKLIKAIYHGDDVYTNFTDEEIYEWTQDLPHKASKEFEEFLQSLPEIILEYDVKCPKCGTSDHYIVKDILDFFIFDTQARM